ncbi:MAG TPA: TIGR00730 family Rossman fold protein [Acidimicrobiia bacterium]|nr:TIGR00730 family Rossman fold protein [Acidimicrobiia bacterium]
MSPKRPRAPRYRTGDRELDASVAELVDRIADPDDADLIFELVVSALRLARDHADRGDLKIANAALKEMRHSFHVFAPYRLARKAAIFGSARTLPDDPLYLHARDLAAALAALDWMVVTGAGPGIMEAGIEGAGPEHAFGVSIKLPFEATTSQFFDGDPKLVNFRYFFTRKLAFIKESDAFVLLPGGFGTLDEAFELLTLLQTGKAQPAPVVLLDTPGGTYWKQWEGFVTAELLATGYVSGDDLRLVHVTDDVDDAVREILAFYRNYHSLRFVDGQLVLRLHELPDPATLTALSDEFDDIVVRGAIEAIPTTKAELDDADHVELPRLAFRFDRRGWARLRMLIDRLNEIGPAPGG